MMPCKAWYTTIELANERNATMNAYYQFINREIQENGDVCSTYRSTQHAQGAWNEHEQHMAAATGILTAELEQYNPRPQMRIGRIGLDIFGVIFAGEFQIITKTIRAGRTIELIESTMLAQGKVCIVARAWRMQTSDTQQVQGTEDVAQSKSMQVWTGMQEVWSGGFIKSIQTFSENRRAGKGVVWVTTDVDMIEGQPTSDFVKLMGLVDVANGIVTRITQPKDQIEWIFPNLDLQIHLLRQPQGRFLGLETVQQLGADGIGLTSSILHDELGVFGRSEQILTVRHLGSN